MDKLNRDSLPVYELDTKYELASLNLNTLSSPQENKPGYYDSKDFLLAIGSRVLFIAAYRMEAAGYEAVRPFSPDDGYEFDSRDFDLKQRSEKLDLTEKLNRRKAERLGDLAVDNALDLSFQLPLIRKDAPEKDRREMLLQGYPDLADQETQSIINKLKLNIYANGMAYQTVPLLDHINDEPEVIDYQMEYFYPMDMGEVASVDYSIGNRIAFTDAEIEENPIEFEFKLIEGRMQVWRQKDADRDSQQTKQTFMPGDPRAMLDEPL